MPAPARLPNGLLLLPVVLIAAYTASVTIADADLWGHVRFGLDALEQGVLPAADPYSFTSDRSWVNHEWLAEAIMGAAFKAGGPAGLIALKIILAACVGLVVWSTLRAAGTPVPASAGLLLAAVLGSGYLQMTMRPQLFSAVLFAVLCAVLNAAARGRPFLLLWLPVLFGVWANLHGGWIVGGLVAGLWAAGAVQSGSLRLSRVAPAGALAALATLANPYGGELWRFLWTTVGVGRADIAEWQPLLRAPFLVFPWALSAAVLALAWRRRGAAGAWRFIPVAVLAILAVRVARLEGFFSLAAVLCLAPLFAGAGPPALPLSRRPTRTEFAAVAVFCAIGLAVAGAAVRSGVSCLDIPAADQPGGWAPEPESVVFLTANRLEGRMLTWFDYGQIAIWHLGGGLRVSYDGRRETVYSEGVQRAHRGFYQSVSDASYARDLGADYVWLPVRLPVVEPLRRDGWVEVFRGSTSVILAREPGPFIQPRPWTGARCYPGP